MVQPRYEILQSAKTHVLKQKAVQATLLTRKKAKYQKECVTCPYLFNIGYIRM